MPTHTANNTEDPTDRQHPTPLSHRDRKHISGPFTVISGQYGGIHQEVALPLHVLVHSPSDGGAGPEHGTTARQAGPQVGMLPRLVPGGGRTRRERVPFLTAAVEFFGDW